MNLKDELRSAADNSPFPMLDPAVLTLPGNERQPADRPAQQRPQTRLRVCIATEEINGPSRNGGIGTGYTGLAEALVAAGHDVTVLYLQGTVAERRPIARWVEHFRAAGLRLVP